MTYLHCRLVVLLCLVQGFVVGYSLSAIESKQLPFTAMSKLASLQKLLRSSIDASAEEMSRYFKVQPGAYGEHDRFLGITMPTLRKIAKDHHELSQSELSRLLKSHFNEERCLALVIMSDVYSKSSVSMEEKDRICKFYLSQTRAINNWNLVDTSAYKILGEHLVRTTGPNDTTLLLSLAGSENMWERRISIVSTLAFIRQQEFFPTITVAERLLYDDHDLIHKAVGWMLREVGKKDVKPLKNFLTQYAAVMPRTMLSYAMEKLSPTDRNRYRSMRTATDKADTPSEQETESSTRSKRSRSKEIAETPIIENSEEKQQRTKRKRGA